MHSSIIFACVFLVSSAIGQRSAYRQPAKSSVNVFAVYSSLDRISRDITVLETNDDVLNTRINRLFDEAVLNQNARLLAEEIEDSYNNRQTQQNNRLDKIADAIARITALNNQVDALNQGVQEAQSQVLDVFDAQSQGRLAISQQQQFNVQLDGLIAQRNNQLTALAANVDDELRRAMNLLPQLYKLENRLNILYDAQNRYQFQTLPVFELSKNNSPITSNFDTPLTFSPTARQSTIIGLRAVQAGDYKYGEGYPQIYFDIVDKIHVDQATFDLVDLSINYHVALQVLGGYVSTFNPLPTH